MHYFDVPDDPDTPDRTDLAGHLFMPLHAPMGANLSQEASPNTTSFNQRVNTFNALCNIQPNHLAGVSIPPEITPPINNSNVPTNNNI